MITVGVEGVVEAAVEGVEGPEGEVKSAKRVISSAGSSRTKTTDRNNLATELKS